MSFFSTSVISGAGMSVQRQVMDVISENLANVNTIQSQDGGPYQKRIPIIGSKQVSSFQDVFGKKMEQKQQIVYISDIIKDTSPPQLDYDPGHPLADEKGYVKKPKIDVSTEMVHMIDATRAYEANVAAYNASKNMAAKALQIGA